MAWADVELYEDKELLSSSCAPFLLKRYTEESIANVYFHDDVKNVLRDDVCLAIPELKNDLDLFFGDDDFALMNNAAKFKNVLMILENVYELVNDYYKELYARYERKYEKELGKIVTSFNRKIGTKGGITLVL